MSSIGAYYELDVTCRGEASEPSGYLINITHIDEAVREHALPLIRDAFGGPAHTGGDVLAAVLERLGAALPVPVRTVRWKLTPYHSLTMTADAPDRYLLSQTFEFAAAHRLHSDAMSDEENRAVYGKCNNPSGHGHNYTLRASVAIERGNGTFTVSTLEGIVDRVVVQRFDHKHLNVDTAEFASAVPSVEHIAMVCHDLLVEPIREAGGALYEVTVWETEKTSCTYPIR